MARQTHRSYWDFFNNDTNLHDAEGTGNETDGGQDDAAQTISELGSTKIPELNSDIHVINIIGEIEGHMVLPSQNKTTKYEHIIPQLVAVEESPDIKGLLIILNTVGGDVEAGLAIAELIATMKKPTVSLVLGGGHSIGVPIATAAQRSFIASSATMTIHPIRVTGMVIGVQQSFDYMERVQDRVIDFVTAHSGISDTDFRRFMMNTKDMTRDIGSIVDAEQAVQSGLINAVGGLSDALAELRILAKSIPNKCS